MKALPWIILWLALWGADGVLAGYRYWAGAVPLAVVLVVAPLLWALNVVTDRIDALESDDARFTGARR